MMVMIYLKIMWVIFSPTAKINIIDIYDLTACLYMVMESVQTSLFIGILIIYGLGADHNCCRRSDVY